MNPDSSKTSLEGRWCFQLDPHMERPKKMREEKHKPELYFL